MQKNNLTDRYDIIICPAFSLRYAIVPKVGVAVRWDYLYDKADVVALKTGTVNGWQSHSVTGDPRVPAIAAVHPAHRGPLRHQQGRRLPGPHQHARPPGLLRARQRGLPLLTWAARRFNPWRDGGAAVPGRGGWGRGGALAPCRTRAMSSAVSEQTSRMCMRPPHLRQTVTSTADARARSLAHPIRAGRGEDSVSSSGLSSKRIRKRPSASCWSGMGTADDGMMRARR